MFITFLKDNFLGCLSNLLDILNIFIYMQFSRYICGNGFPLPNGDGEIRTLDPLLARQVLSQLSYTPTLVLKMIFS